MDYKLIISICVILVIAIIFAIASVKIQNIANDTEETSWEFWTRVLIVFGSEILCIAVTIIVYMIFSKISSTSDNDIVVTESHEKYTTPAVELADTSNFVTNPQQA